MTLATVVLAKTLNNKCKRSNLQSNRNRLWKIALSYFICWPAFGYIYIFKRFIWQ